MVSMTAESVAPPAGEAQDYSGPRSRRLLVAWSFVACAALAALGPGMAVFGRRLWAAEHFRFFPLLLAAAAWLGWRRFRGSPWGVAGGLAAYGAWAAVLAAAAAAVLLSSPYAAALAGLGFVLAALYETGGRSLVRRMLPVWALLLVAVPPPLGWDRAMVVSLQRLATSFASGTLDRVGFRHVVEGVAIRSADASFFVDEACSGVHSLYASAAFVSVLAVGSGYGVVRAFALLCGTVGWVIVGNAVRVVSVVLLSSWYHLPVVHGAGHEVLGAACFLIVVTLILSTDRLMFFVSPGWMPGLESGSQAGTRRHPAGHDPGRHRSSAGASPARLAFAGVAFAGLAALGAALPEPPAAGVRYDGAVKWRPAMLSETTVPRSVAGWTRAEGGSPRTSAVDPTGEWSRLWVYRKGRLSAVVSVDGPYAGWHDLADCYGALDFDVVTRDRVREDGTVSSADPGTELVLRGTGGRYALSYFSAYALTGEPIPPPSSLLNRAKAARLAASRVFSRAWGGREDVPVFQIQVYAEGRVAFSDRDRAQVRDLFVALRKPAAAAIGRALAGASAGVPGDEAGAVGGEP
jgi:exosortase